MICIPSIHPPLTSNPLEIVILEIVAVLRPFQIVFVFTFALGVVCLVLLCFSVAFIPLCLLLLSDLTCFGLQRCPKRPISDLFPSQKASSRLKTFFVSSVRSSYSHPDLLLIHPPHPTTPLFQITPVLNTGLSLSEPLQL